MTTWPDPARPGVPSNPLHSGPHQMDDLNPEPPVKGPWVLLWSAPDRTWTDLFGNICGPEAVARLSYLGPCLTPGEVAKLREAHAKLAEAEPELPGDPPERLASDIARRPVDYMREAVRAAKRSIAAAIRQTKPPSPCGGCGETHPNPALDPIGFLTWRVARIAFKDAYRAAVQKWSVEDIEQGLTDTTRPTHNSIVARTRGIQKAVYLQRTGKRFRVTP